VPDSGKAKLKTVVIKTRSFGLGHTSLSQHMRWRYFSILACQAYSRVSHAASAYSIWVPLASANQTPHLGSDLAAVLRGAGRALSLPELFSQAGFDRDQPEHVEIFYLALRTQLGQTIRKTGGAIENAALEAINAP
jgi:hypothetical protein